MTSEVVVSMHPQRDSSFPRLRFCQSRYTAAPEIDVDVKKVALEEMQTPPFRARVDFYLVYYSPADHSELKRDLYTANFVFLFKSQVPNELIPINPLGLSITYFREDQAFK